MNITDINLAEAVFVDVRTEEEFIQDHLVGAINIPLNDIFFRIEEFEEMVQPIILYCHSGSRSQTALDMLRDQGVKNVFNGGSLNNLKNILS